jgi:hypothetical protein
VKPVAFKIWPEIGVPISKPIETTVALRQLALHCRARNLEQEYVPEKHIPMRVPIIARLGVKCTRIVGGSETKLPEKNPYSAQMTITGARLCAAIKQSARTPDSMAQGMIILRGPVRSAMKFGMIRPNTEPAFKTDSR